MLILCHLLGSSPPVHLFVRWHIFPRVELQEIKFQTVDSHFAATDSLRFYAGREAVNEATLATYYSGHPLPDELMNFGL